MSDDVPPSARVQAAARLHDRLIELYESSAEVREVCDIQDQLEELGSAADVAFQEVGYEEGVSSPAGASSVIDAFLEHLKHQNDPHERARRLSAALEELAREDIGAFRLIESMVVNVVNGVMVSTCTLPKRGRGRPLPVERDVDAMSHRLAELRREDDARACVRQAVGMGTPKPSRRLSSEENARRSLWIQMLRDELDAVASGLELPRLANVLLLMLDERGADRQDLVVAACRAGVLKNGGNKRENLADRLGATRKALGELREIAAVRERLVRNVAWWPSSPLAPEAARHLDVPAFETIDDATRGVDGVGGDRT